MTGQILRFAAVGVASTLAYIAAFALLRTVTGARTANLLALLITAVGNTAANRRLTFGITGRQGAGRHQAQGLAVFALGLALTSGSLALLAEVSPQAGHLAELAVVILTDRVAAPIRFLLMRTWRRCGGTRWEAWRNAAARPLETRAATSGATQR